MEVLTPFRPKGYKFFNEDGSLCATLTRDVYVNEVCLNTDFVLSDGTTPLPGKDMPKAILKDFSSKETS